MAKLDEIIAKQLAEATAVTKDKKLAELKGEAGGVAYEVDTKPSTKKELTKEEAEVEAVAPVVETKFEVSAQVATLLEAEGLSEEFKEQAVTIFEAAVTDRVLQIEEGLQEKFEEQLAEAKADLDSDIDGFLNEAIQQWMQENVVAIESNFKLQLAESFMDGMQALMGKHNIELAEGKEDALDVALGEVDSLTEAVATKETEKLALVEQINVMKAEKILESFKEEMAHTEFDRFVQLTESVKFVDEVQYAKQLTVVLENFGKQKQEPKVGAPITEEVVTPVASVSTVDRYASFISNKR